jgi:hypothetical protein
MLAAYSRARQAGQERMSQLALWVLAYWIAFLVNASFDVFLEGPQGDIWFWSIFGFGIVITRTSQEEAARAAIAAALHEGA